MFGTCAGSTNQLSSFLRRREPRGSAIGSCKACWSLWVRVPVLALALANVMGPRFRKDDEVGAGMTKALREEGHGSDREVVVPLQERWALYSCYMKSNSDCHTNTPHYSGNRCSDNACDRQGERARSTNKPSGRNPHCRTANHC